MTLTNPYDITSSHTSPEHYDTNITLPTYKSAFISPPNKRWRFLDWTHHTSSHWKEDFISLYPFCHTTL
jgi:hypothetical protein